MVVQLNMHCCFGHEFVQSEQDLWSFCRKSSNKALLIGRLPLWRTVLLENTPNTQSVDQETTRTSQLILVQGKKKMHLQQKALILQYFFILKRFILSHVCKSQLIFSLIFLEIPAFVWVIHHVLFMAQCFSYWLLNVVLYCLQDDPDETAMFNLNYSSPILGGILCML